LLIACAPAHAVTVLIMRRSILTEKVARRGYHVMREYIVNPLTRVRVGDVMEPDAPTIPADQKVDLLFRRLAAHDPVLGRRYAWPLVNEAGALVGIVTRGDLVRALEQPEDGDLTVLEAGSTELVVTYPDEMLDEALDKMIHHDIGRLPVVERHNPKQLLGYLGRTGIAAGWRRLVDEEQIREVGWLSRVSRRRDEGPDQPSSHTSRPSDERQPVDAEG
jgi:chloride channel protein, CIC family